VDDLSADREWVGGNKSFERDGLLLEVRCGARRVLHSSFKQKKKNLFGFKQHREATRAEGAKFKW
jgi:hypothetical protein